MAATEGARLFARPTRSPRACFNEVEVTVGQEPPLCAKPKQGF